MMGKAVMFSAVPAFEMQHKIVEIYNLMLNRITDEKDSFISETLKKSIENGVITLVIRILDDTKATEALLDCVKAYEDKHSKEEPIYEARKDKVFRKQVRVMDRTMREVIENAIAGKPSPRAEEFFKDSDDRVYNPKSVQ